MSESEEFQKVFIELTQEMDCTISQVPKRLGIAYDIYTKIRDYGKIPSPKILIRIADYFNVSIEYLLGRTHDTYFEGAKERKTFKERFKQLREKHHMTEYAVTKKLHIFTCHISNWNRFNYTPSLDTLIILSQVFKVSLDYLLGRTDDPTPYDDIEDNN